MTDVLEEYRKMQDLVERYYAAKSLISEAKKIASKNGFAFYAAPFGDFRGDLTVERAKELRASSAWEFFEWDTRDHIEEVIESNENHYQDDDYDSWRTSFC
jgi:hypothetical protein